MKQTDLTGKHAIITGGASGIGEAIARCFADNGAIVSILDVDGERALATAQNINSQARGIACNVMDAASVDIAFATATEDRPVDILVNSAGVAHVGTILTTTVEDLDRLYGVNVRGTYLVMRATVRQMEKRRSGVILNMASIAATAGLPDRFAYSMTKGAVLSMTLSVARDFIGQNIRCNCISPARVHTPFVDGFVAKNYPGKEEEMLAKLASAQPIGRMGEPSEIAWLALYLCSDAASFVTGQDYPIDGGFFRLR